MSQSRVLSRRKLLSDAARGVGAATVATGFPAIVPSSVFGATSPSNRLKCPPASKNTGARRSRCYKVKVY